MTLQATMPVPRRDWRAGALCASRDPSNWFPSRGNSSAARARRVCAVCPVLKECRQYALQLPPGYTRYGIWGGLSARQINAMRQEVAK